MLVSKGGIHLPPVPVKSVAIRRLVDIISTCLPLFANGNTFANIVEGVSFFTGNASFPITIFANAANVLQQDCLVILDVDLIGRFLPIHDAVNYV